MNKNVEKIITTGSHPLSENYKRTFQTKRITGEFGQYYRLVPKRFQRNLRWRDFIMRRALESDERAYQYWVACKRDVLFWINTFAWLFEPRRSQKWPFITYPYQDPFILTMVEEIEKSRDDDPTNPPRDVHLEKSRDMGATWMYLMVMYWVWLFHDMSTMGIVSRTEDAVDKTSDPDTLMWKFDFQLEHTPWFLLPHGFSTRNRGKLRLENPENGSTIMGYSATGDVARGGRKLCFGMDEMASWSVEDSYAAAASTQSVADTRFIVSTPQGAAGYFYDMAQKPSEAVAHITQHWVQHPLKCRGLYTSRREGFGPFRLDVLDENYDFPGDYNFILDGKYRSPWYDRECARSPIPFLIAQELDIDYTGSVAQVYDPEILQNAERTVIPPLLEGEINFSDDTYDPSWLTAHGGRWKLWLNLATGGRAPSDAHYVMGADVATGKAGEKSSNSVLAVINSLTGEKVAEFAAHDIDPIEFAKVAKAAGYFFKGFDKEAYLIWEDNGPGTIFGTSVRKLGYTNFYFRQQEKVITKKKTLVPGWWSTADTKRALLGEHARAIGAGELIERSEHTLAECRDYVFNGKSVEHVRAIKAIDASGAKENHGDRVIATAVAWKGVTDRPSRRKATEEPRVIPTGSFAHRRQEHERLRQSKTRC